MRSTESGRVLSEINGWPLSMANTFVVGNLRFINELMVITAIAILGDCVRTHRTSERRCFAHLGAVIIRKGTKNRLESYSEIQKSLDLKQAR